MSTKNKSNSQQANTVTAEGQQETATQAVADMPAETAANVVHFSERKGGTNGFAAFNARQSAAVQGKAKLMQEAAKLLTQAAEAVAKGDLEADKANEPAAKGGMLLFKGMASGTVSNDEASDILGSTFGWKTTSKGEQSKTPLGLGEVIRKRVRRAFQAYDYAINGNEPVAFFEPLEREDVAPLVEALLADTLDGGLWTFYTKSGDLKAEKTGKRPKAAFDPKRIAALARDLGENIPETVAIIQRTPGLFAAYAGLLRMIETIGAEMPVPETESEAA